MLAEEAADDTEPDRLVRGGRRRQCRRLVSGSHDLANGRPILRLQLPIVAALIRQIKRLMRADRVDERCRNARALQLCLECRKPAGIGRAPLVDLGSRRIERRQFGNALREFGFQEIRLQGQRPAQNAPSPARSWFHRAAPCRDCNAPQTKRDRCGARPRIVRWLRRAGPWRAGRCRDCSARRHRAGAIAAARSAAASASGSRPEPLQQHGEPEMGVREVRPKRSRLSIMLFSARELRRQLERGGKIEVRQRRGRARRSGPAQTARSLRQIVQPNPARAQDCCAPRHSRA